VMVTVSSGAFPDAAAGGGSAESGGGGSAAAKPTKQLKSPRTVALVHLSLPRAMRFLRLGRVGLT